MKDSSHFDREWTAFCYLADELPAAQRRRFERLLAEDQTAREALAQAVELSQAIAAALPAASGHEAGSGDKASPAAAATSASARRRNMAKAGWWMGVGAAICLAVILGYGSLGGPPLTGRLASNGGAAEKDSAEAGARNLAAGLDQAALAKAWLKTRDELVTRQPEPADAADAPDEHPAEMPSLAAPPWLFNAVAADMLGDDYFNDLDGAEE